MARADVVVVGAGSAGCALAGELGRSGAARDVLLLEAGPGDEPSGVASPNFFRALNEPGRIWPALVARRTPHSHPQLYLRGRGLGGSSSVNALVALWPEEDDHASWRGICDDESWSWRGTAAERAGVEARVPLVTVPRHRWGAVDRAMATAGEALGYHVEPARLTLRDGERVSAARAYLPAPRVQVRAGALVDCVLFDKRRAVGVRLASGEEIEARTVVVCAGAIHSPAILLRSGVDRPGVGRNLCDHAAIAAVLVLKDHAVERELDRPATACLARWSSGEDRNDLQFLPMNRLAVGRPAARLGMVMTALMEARSRGSVELVSDDPSVDPAIDFRLLSDDFDRRRLAIGALRMFELLRDPAFDEISEAVAVDEDGTPPEAIVEDLDHWLVRRPGDYVHAVGTCRIGRSGDANAVVDASLRVIGYEGLYVADASVLPTVPRVNTNLIAMLVGHRAARIIASASVPGVS